MAPAGDGLTRLATVTCPVPGGEPLRVELWVRWPDRAGTTATGRTGAGPGTGTGGSVRVTADLAVPSGVGALDVEAVVAGQVVGGRVVLGRSDPGGDHHEPELRRLLGELGRRTDLPAALADVVRRMSGSSSGPTG